MAAPVKKGAAPAKKAKSYSVKGLYEVSGDTMKRLNQTCPKCGPSFYLAEHANRRTCGKCGYTEFKKN